MKILVKEKEKRVDRLLRFLQTAYRQRDHVRIQPRWRADVMRRVQQIGAPGQENAFFQSIADITWKLAPVTALLIVVCFYALVRFEPVSIWEVLCMIPDEMTADAILHYL